MRPLGGYEAGVRVLHVIADLGTYGAQNLVGQLIRELRNEPDCRVEALTIYSPEVAFDAGAALGVPVHDLARRGRRDLSFLPRLVAAIRRLRPDIVHTHMHHGKYWGRLAAILAGVPTIVHTEHNSDFRPPHPLFGRLNRVLHAKTTAIVAFSEPHRAALARDEHLALERIAIIPNGITPSPPDRAAARAALGAGDETFAVVHVGRLATVKNQLLALDAWEQLTQAQPGMQLIFVGDGPDREMLADQVALRGLHGVRFLGFREDAHALIAGADVALVTSRNEAMPLAVIEAMQAGVPVVSSDWHGAREMLGFGAYGLVAAADGASLAAAITAVANDPAAAAERAGSAQRHALAEFAIATTARRYAALYRSLSSRARSASAVITAARS